MAKEWFVRLMGDEIGPMEPSELRRMAEDKRITIEDEVRRGINGRWITAGEVQGLFSPAVKAAPVDDPLEQMALGVLGPGKARPQASQVQQTTATIPTPKTVRRNPALQTCPACRREVSQDAFKCVGCGHRLKDAKRTVIGAIIKWSFILFNVLMVLWLGRYLLFLSDHFSRASDAGQIGTAIGGSIGISFLCLIWLVGALVLGMLTLMTRPKSD